MQDKKENMKSHSKNNEENPATLEWKAGYNTYESNIPFNMNESRHWKAGYMWAYQMYYTKQSKRKDSDSYA